METQILEVICEEGWCIEVPVCIVCEEYIEDCRCFFKEEEEQGGVY